MARMDNSAGEISLYRQVETILRDQIVDGVLRAGDRLPAEEVLREEFGISRGTLRMALDALEQDGLLERERGRGTFVSAGAARHTMRSRLDLDRMIQSATQAKRLLRQGRVAPPAVAARALGLGDGEECPFFIRLSGERRSGSIGVKRYLAPFLRFHAENLAAERDFDAAVAGLGTVQRGDAWVEAILAEPRFAMQLKVPLGSPLLSVWWVDMLDGRRAVCTHMLRPGASAALTVSSKEVEHAL